MYYINNAITEYDYFEKYVILSNRLNGNYIFIQKDIFDIFFECEFCIDKNEIKSMYDMSEIDKKYICDLIDVMYNMDLLQDRKIEYIRNESIDKIVIKITNKCNLACSYCCMSSNINENNMLSTNDCKRLFDYIVELDPEQIIISGGEPTIREDFTELIKYLRGIYNGYLSISTNLTSGTNRIVSVMNYIDGIDVSVDGFDEESCRRYRGRGVFNVVDKNIDILKKYDKKITLSTIVDDYNFNKIEQFKEYCSRKNVIPSFKRFFAIGRGNNEIIKFLEDVDSRISMKMDEKLSINNCKAGLKQIFVNEYGDIYPCSLLEYENYKIGNINDLNSTKELLDRSISKYYEMRQLEKTKRKECLGCKFSMFCSPCPAMIMQVIEQKHTYKKYCDQRKNILENKCNEYFEEFLENE